MRVAFRARTPATRERNAQEDALALLRQRGYSVGRVVRLESPGDGGAGAAEVLYVTLEDKAMRAYIVHRPGSTPLLWVRDGWDLAGGYDAEADDGST